MVPLSLQIVGEGSQLLSEHFIAALYIKRIMRAQQRKSAIGARQRWITSNLCEADDHLFNRDGRLTGLKRCLTN
ncbi:hypothetical protein A9762_12085 [Pandoraea sp. ISTKB]|nr:hypothetical protein A9762_12085 [Pandoraea sp. ISTKB]